MSEETKKIQVPDQWAEKYLRESLWMPFGSLCNLVGQAYQGKGITAEELQTLAQAIFVLTMSFTESAYTRTERESKDEGPDIPRKK